MPIPLRTQLIQAVPWFFGPCFEHLGFLLQDHGFWWDGEDHGGPDAYARLVFTDDKLEVQVLSWLPMGLPRLTVTSIRRGKRRVLDLRAVVPQQVLADDSGDYYGRFMQVHPLNELGRAAVDREFEAAAAERIRGFGATPSSLLRRTA